MSFSCPGTASDPTCAVINARLFEATDTAARFLWTSQDLSGNAVVTTGTLYYRELNSGQPFTAVGGGSSSSFNVLVTGLTPGTQYEWYAESCVDGVCCESSLAQFTTEGDVVQPTGECKVQANNDFAAFEVELVDEFGGWQAATLGGPTQGESYEWQGGNNFFQQEAGEDILKFRVCIPVAGNYVFKIHSFSDTSADPSRPDLANDVWVRFPTGVDVPGQVTALQSWIKVFRPGTLANQWSWVSAAEHLSQQWVETVQFFSAGEHCIELSGRSNGHIIDRMALCRQGFNQDPATLPASPLIDCDGPAKELPSSSLYDPNCEDVIALHFDLAPDLDDLHAIAAACSLSRCFDIDPCVVIGTYGLNNQSGNHMQQYLTDTNFLGQSGPPFQGNTTRRQMGIDVATAAFGANGFLDTGDGFQQTANATAAKWKVALDAGCEVWVADGGPMDFTAEVLRELVSLGCTQVQLQNNVHVIQHASFNITQTLAVNFNYVQNNSDYQLIPNGNNPNNGSADLEDPNVNTTNSVFAQWARASECGAAWGAALDRFQFKVDFSDTVEYLHILGIGTQSINTLQDFCDFVD